MLHVDHETMTYAQRLTVTRLRGHEEVVSFGPCDCDVFPDAASASGAVLVLLTPYCGEAPNAVVAVWSSSGRSCLPVRGEEEYVSALGYVRADGLRPIVQRESSTIFRVEVGGVFERVRL